MIQNSRKSRIDPSKQAYFARKAKLAPNLMPTSFTDLQWSEAVEIQLNQIIRILVVAVKNSLSNIINFHYKKLKYYRAFSKKL